MTERSEVVREGPGDGYFLEPNGDCVGFGGADPDREVPVGLFFLQDDHALIVHQTHAYRLDGHLDHTATSQCRCTFNSSPAL